MLERGADVNCVDSEGRSPLNRCLLHNWKFPDAQYATHTAIAGLMVGCGTHDGLWAAADLGDVTGVEDGLEAEPEGLHGEREDNPVVVSAFRGHVAARRALLDAGTEIDPLEAQLQSTSLDWAVRYGNGALVRYLLHRGADPNGTGADWARPLAWAERKGYDESAAARRDQGATLA